MFVTFLWKVFRSMERLYETQYTTHVETTRRCARQVVWRVHIVWGCTTYTTWDVLMRAGSRSATNKKTPCFFLPLHILLKCGNIHIYIYIYIYFDIFFYIFRIFGMLTFSHLFSHLSHLCTFAFSHSNNLRHAGWNRSTKIPLYAKFQQEM